MTKYIEEHNFNFDNVFDETADNSMVSLVNFIVIDLSDVRAAADRVHL